MFAAMFFTLLVGIFIGRLTAYFEPTETHKEAIARQQLIRDETREECARLLDINLDRAWGEMDRLAIIIRAGRAKEVIEAREAWRRKHGA